MKFNVSSKTLYNYASAVSKIINNKNPMAILNNFYLAVKGDTLTIRGEDMDNFLEGRLMISNAEGEGSFCLDARRLVELLKLMPDQGIDFEVDDNLGVKISYANGCYNTVAIDGEEFPNTNGESDSSNQYLEFECNASTAIAGMDHTLFAVGDDEIRPQMTGVLWDVKPDQLIFVSTDTRKLVKYIDTSKLPGIECSFILPVKGATILKSVFSKTDVVKVKVSPVDVVFESEDFTFDCRLIKGNFPDYNRVIPKNNPYSLSVDCQSFLNSVRRVAIGGDEGSNLIKFQFDTGTLTLTSVDAAYNTSGWENVPCEYDGPQMQIGFDGKYLIDILTTFSSTDIMMKIGDPSRPALMVPLENEPDTELTIILMPMNIIG